ncbi:MAG: hypothetical protein BZY80_01245 [SAR202 cluster bacterium Io17-Chloro-G2]|nr:MAG: hypothetical protein BZY80_01245 [SAR202 cluster bacterium Io17-Chloro-G2]
MFVQVEPAEFFMYRVKLIFDLENPDSEDQEARDYLEEKELEPRYLSNSELDGRQCEIMQFGGCYLGKHLDHLGQIQRRAVEVEVLTEEIRGHLASEGDGPAPSIDEALMAALVEEFHQDSAFQAAENGELVAVLDADTVRAAARQHAAAGR